MLNTNEPGFSSNYGQIKDFGDKSSNLSSYLGQTVEKIKITGLSFQE